MCGSAIVGDGWLAEEVELDLRPGGDAAFRSGETTKTGWVEDVLAPARLAFWWAADGEPASRVELSVLAEARRHARARRRDRGRSRYSTWWGLPLPGVGGQTFGPALVAA